MFNSLMEHWIGSNVEEQLGYHNISLLAESHINLILGGTILSI